jgi:hypothetical protein
MTRTGRIFFSKKSERASLANTALEMQKEIMNPIISLNATDIGIVDITEWLINFNPFIIPLILTWKEKQDKLST